MPPSATSDIEAELLEFFRSYGQAAIHDASAFAACWNYPAHSTRIEAVTGKIRLFPVPSEEEFVREVVKTDKLFRASGFCRAHVDVVAIDRLSEAIVQTAAHWKFLDESGHYVADANAVYTLGRFGGNLRIVQAVWLGIVPRDGRKP